MDTPATNTATIPNVKIKLPKEHFHGGRQFKKGEVVELPQDIVADLFPGAEVVTETAAATPAPTPAKKK